MQRKPLSPSALEKWLENKEEYYLKYLAVDRPPRIPQNEPMSVGAAFDAYVKCFIHRRIFGDNHTDSEFFVFERLFEKQVEEHNRDFAMKAGANCFIAYKNSGALAELLKMLGKSETPPMMNYDVEGITGEVGGVSMTGKPDLTFKIQGHDVVLDWKVNGYCSTSTSRQPASGYLFIYDGFEPKSKYHGRMSRDCIPHELDGMTYSLSPSIEMNETSWARQLSTYSWLRGAPVGSDIICAIDQLVCRPGPTISVALHRCPITARFQQGTLSLYQQLWTDIHSGHFFTEMSLDESKARCEMLDKQGQIYSGEHGDFLKSLRS